jgi:hypothetical protein
MASLEYQVLSCSFMVNLHLIISFPLVESFHPCPLVELSVVSWLGITWIGISFTLGCCLLDLKFSDVLHMMCFQISFKFGAGDVNFANAPCMLIYLLIWLLYCESTFCDSCIFASCKTNIFSPCLWEVNLSISWPLSQHEKPTFGGLDSLFQIGLYWACLF